MPAAICGSQCSRLRMSGRRQRSRERQACESRPCLRRLTKRRRRCGSLAWWRMACPDYTGKGGSGRILDGSCGLARRFSGPRSGAIRSAGSECEGLSLDQFNWEHEARPNERGRHPLDGDPRVFRAFKDARLPANRQITDSHYCWGA